MTQNSKVFFQNTVEVQMQQLKQLFKSCNQIFQRIDDSI